MNWLVLIAVITGSLATPIQQEGRQFRDEIRNSDGTVVGKYGSQEPSGKDGLISPIGQEGVPFAPVWSPDQMIVVDPAPLTYGPKGDQVITARDQQRYVTNEEEVEAREDVSDEESKPVVNEPKVDVDPKDDSVEDPKPAVYNEYLAVKGVQRQVLSNDQTVFPQVTSGQRRLVEPQIAQQYAVKGKGLRPLIGITNPVQRQQVIYQAVQQGLPISIEEHRVTPQGIKRPVVQYQLNPIQQLTQVPREWIRRPYQPVYQQQQTHGVKTSPRHIQYVIQPVIPSSVDLVQRQPQVVQPQVQQQVFTVPEVQNVGQIGEQRYVRVPVVGQRQYDVPVGQQPQVVGAQVDSVVQGVHDVDQLGVAQRVHDVDHRPVHVVQGVQDVPKSDVLVQKQQVKPQVVSHVSHVDHVVGDQKVVPETGRHVPVVSGQRIISYQLVDTHPQQQHQYIIQPVPTQQTITSSQQPVQQSIYTQYSQPQNIQYVPYIPQQQIPISDIQQYYQVMSGIPVQTNGQQQQQPENQYILYFGQNPTQTQPIPIQYSGLQVSQEQPVQGLQGVHVQGPQGLQVEQGVPVQGVQGIHGVQDDVPVSRGQDLRVTPLNVNRQRPVLGQTVGVKSAIHV